MRVYKATGSELPLPLPQQLMVTPSHLILFRLSRMLLGPCARVVALIGSLDLHLGPVCEYGGNTQQLNGLFFNSGKRFAVFCAYQEHILQHHRVCEQYVQY